MSAHHTLPIPRKAPRSEGEGVHAELMRQIGAKSYDPMPSTQHRWLMDISNPPPMRIMGFLYSVTIGAGKELKRSAYARDERGPVKAERVAAEFGWSVSRTNVYLRQLEETGHIRRDEKGWMWLGGAVDEPRRIQGENEENTDAEGDAADLCTYIGDRAFALYLQQLDKNEVDKGRRDAARAAAHRTMELEALEKQAIADASALIRARIREEVNALKRAVNFPVDESRGRPRKDRPEPVIQITLLPLSIYEQKSTPISEQKSKPASVQKEIDCVQKCSYIEEQSAEITEKNSLSSLSPSAPANPPPQGKDERAPIPPANEESQLKPLKLEGILALAHKIGMSAPAAHLPEIRDLWHQLTPDEQSEAVFGLEVRNEVGEYDEIRFIPRLRRYLGEKLWQEKVRPRKKPKNTEPSYLDRLIAGEEA